MRINTNINSMNAVRNMSINNKKTAASSEKLSSGYRINKAGDDAAGLAISEKMRSQIRGLDQASSNAEDANSLIQTAEGALNETHSILQRMNELAVQSANDTNVDETDRQAIQDEMDELSKELTRISNDTEFNTQKLLDGSFSGTFHIGANKGQEISLSINSMSAESLQVCGGSKVDVGTEAKYSFVNTTGNTYNLKINDLGSDAIAETTAEITGNTITITLAQTAKVGEEDGASTATYDDVVKAINNAIVDSKITGLTAYVKTGVTGSDKADTSGYTGSGASIDTSTPNEEKGIDVSTQTAANNAIKTIQDAVQTVSRERSKLGAYQNRLDHTINNLGTSSENLSAAESRIRDVDMAKEMSEYTKNSVLAQAAQSMVAQANSQPQSVLSLLQ